MSGPEGHGLAFLKLSPTFWVGVKVPSTLGAATVEEGTAQEGGRETLEWGTGGRGQRKGERGKPQHRPEPSFLHRRKNSLKPLTRKDVPPEVRYAKYQV